jgi:hypothetical protein
MNRTNLQDIEDDREAEQRDVVDVVADDQAWPLPLVTREPHRQNSGHRVQKAKDQTEWRKVVKNKSSSYS